MPDEPRPGTPSLTTERLLSVLAGSTTGPVPRDEERLTAVGIAGGRGSGPLVGGCLGDLVHTLGTPWEPDLDGAILFLEESGQAPIRIDRALLHLHQAGKLDETGVTEIDITLAVGSVSMPPSAVPPLSFTWKVKLA